MTYTAVQANRAVSRIFEKLSKQAQKVRDADAGYDAGEFSGSFHDDQEELSYNRILELVSEKMDVPIREIYAAGTEQFAQEMEMIHQRGLNAYTFLFN